MCLPSVARAWDSHDQLTELALQAYEGWEDFVYEPLEKVLPVLSVKGAPAPTSSLELARQLKINSSKVKWDWQPSSPTVITLLTHGVNEADEGMDQNLDVSPHQKYMGGTTGMSSQGFRHMFYRAWSMAEPLVTFHVPFHEIGEAPERAQTYFDLAVQAKKAGHLFWAYRFLGIGLHYVQDVSQPFHSNQLGSLRLFPLWIILTRGYEAGVGEATRLSGNFHLSFEQYTSYLLKRSAETELSLAFKVPKGDDGLKITLEQNLDLSINEGVRQLAQSSSRLAPDVVESQEELMGKLLRDPRMDIIPGWLDAQGGPKIDLEQIDSDSKLAKERKNMFESMFAALSNTGVATRWYIDRFKAAK